MIHPSTLRPGASIPRRRSGRSSVSSRTIFAPRATWFPRHDKDALLIITHADQDASFDYEDYWDGDDLIYTGRGQDGDQALAGANRDVAENRRQLWIFQRHEKYMRQCMGRAVCVKHWWGIAPDKNGLQRRVLRFCLRLQNAQALARGQPRPRRLPHRKARPFDESAAPTPPSPGVISTTSDEIAQLKEKANAAHHALLVALKRCLERAGWTDIEEIPAAVDLWGRIDKLRTIFEAKTITRETELAQTRAAMAQLLEYRYFYDSESDHLCLVVDSPLSDRRLRFLSAMGIHALWHNGKRFVPCAGEGDGSFATLGIGEDG